MFICVVSGKLRLEFISVVVLFELGGLMIMY